MKSENVQYIILRKTPYRETSLVVAGISRSGRIDLLVRGARKTAAKNLPAIDLFREIEVNVDPAKDGLQPVYSAELVSSFDDIAMNSRSYLDACEISRFILRNSHPGVSAPASYASVKTAFEALSTSGEIAYSPLVKLIFLEEHGLLPEIPEGRESERVLLNQLLNAGKGSNPMPEIDPEYMKKIAEWIETLCNYNEL